MIDEIAILALKKSGAVDVSAAVAAKVAAQAAQSAAETAQAAAEDAAEDAVEALASEYSTSSTYAVGDYCVKDGVLYRCTTAISTAESWTAAHWTATKVTTELASDYSSLKSQITQKANANGSYDEMTVGSASQLLSAKGLTDKVPYLFRRSGGNGANRAKETAIVGGTIAWNQLVQNGNFTSTSYWDKVASVSGGVATSVSVARYVGIGQSVSIPATHKIFVQVTATADSDRDLAITLNANSGAVAAKTFSVTQNTMKTVTAIITASVASDNIGVRNWSADSAVLQAKNFYACDLTAALTPAIADYIYSLETATAGAGIAKLRSWGLCIKDYYEYDAGSLQSVQVAGKVTNGFNQIGIAGRTLGTLSGSASQTKRAFKDTEYYSALSDVGYYSSTSVTNIVLGEGSVSATIVNAGYGVAIPFKVIPGASYCFHHNKVSTDGTPYVVWYNFEGYRITSYGISQDRVLTAPDDTEFGVVILTSSTNNTTIKYEHICINLSDPTRNGEYAPYESHTYPLDSSLTLRGIPKLDASNNLYYDGDTYESDGMVTRKYAEVDLGTLDWTYVNSTSTPIFQTTIASIGGHSSHTNCICVGYVTKGDFWNTAGNDRCIAFGGSLNISNSAYTDAATFKTAMSGVKLAYELATPTTESATPFQTPQIVDPYGTEEFIDAAVTASTPTRDVAIPVGHETYYPENASEKLAGLPWDFSTLIATTEKGFTATKPYSVNEFLIIDNQLYIVTASIANGATITPNTNVTATTIGAQITALLNA